MALIKGGSLIADEYQRVGDEAVLPEAGAVLVSLERLQADRERLLSRTDPVGVWLRSDQPPALVEDVLPKLALVALDFPAFTDGRAYSYARLLRERFGFEGEVRATGDVHCEQLHFMQRSGFDAFEIEGERALEEWKTAEQDFSAWYQPTADGRRSVLQLRHKP